MKLALAGLMLLALTLPALAADPTAVSIPWGNWLDAFIAQIILPILSVLIVSAVAWAAKFLPASLRAYATTKNTAAVEQLLGKAISFGLTKVEGAAAGQTLTVPVGSSVLATSAQYAVDHGPTWLLNWAGGEQGIREKILARLPIEPAADGSQVLAQAAPAIS